MNYTETNKLIAEFMGAYSEPLYCGIDGSSRTIYRFPNKSFDDYISDFENETPYHTDWNWLMPVGKKIYDYMQAYDRPNENAVCQGDWLETNIGCAIREYDMAKAHENIIEFINWYNSNLPTPSIA